MRALLFTILTLATTPQALAAAPQPAASSQSDLQELERPGACAALAQKTRQVDSVPLKRLDELPSAVLEHAVLRIVEGCLVREVRYQGRTYYANSAFPAASK